MPGLGTSFGRGGATTAQQDLVNADAILIIGSSMAEAHPVGFRWVVKARERGAFVVHVDPRFSRTSALADRWAPIRAGSDIVFFGGLINYVLTHDREVRDALIAHLRTRTIHAVFHYVPLHGAPFAQEMGIEADLPVTDDVAARIVRLPFYNDLSEVEMETIVDAVHEFFGVRPSG